MNPQAAHIPDHIAYFNVASDIRWTLKLDLVGNTFGIRERFSTMTTTGSLGDYVMLQGDDRPTALPLLGGERFDPSTIGRGDIAHQWILSREVVTQMSATITYIPLAPIVDVSYEFPDDPLHVPESHLALGAKVDQITVRDRITGQDVPLTDAILLEIQRGDR